MFLFAGEMDCSGPAEPPMTAWEQVAVECVLTAPDGGAPLSGAGVLQPVSQACAEAMGEAIAMDWESFDETPRAFTTAVTPAEIVIGGALVAAGTQGFTVGAALDEQAPATMTARLERFRGLDDLVDDDDAGLLWAPFLADAVDEVHYTGSADYVMRYSEGRIDVGDLDGEEDVGLSAGAEAVLVPQAASFLVHEASHSFYAGHGSCEPLETTPYVWCDDTSDGAYGVGAWWLWTWLGANADRLDEFHCREAQHALYEQCQRIVDVAGFAACAGVEIECG